MSFSKKWNGYFIYFYATLYADVVFSTSVNRTSNEETVSKHSFPIATTVAAVVGTSMLLSAFVIVLAFLFCCKSKSNSESLDPPEESTSMVSLTDHVEPNNAQVIGNPAIVMQEMVAKGRNKISKMTSSRRQDDTQKLNTCSSTSYDRQDIQF